MKQAIGGAIVLAGVAWLMFVFTTPDACERIHRAASPVRATFDLTRWATKNWLSTEARLDLLRISVQADEATQGFLGHQFFGESFTCRPAGAPPEASGDVPELAPVAKAAA